MSSREDYFDIDSIENDIDRAYHCGINFYACRKPGDDKFVFGASTHICSVKKRTGFVVAPFDDSKELKPFLIPNDYGVDFPSEYSGRRNYCVNASSTSYEDYLRQANTIIDYLKRNGGKVVLSKIIVKQLNLSVGKLFSLLAETYHKAFVFCFYTADTGLWLGATPELLLDVKSGEIATMALAGTRPANSKMAWDDKCIEEQQIVTDYISSCLNSKGLRLSVGDPHLRVAGPVEHICTDIKAEIPNDCDLWSLVSDLSPTPALAGYPKRIAMRMISEIECHDREYYGGYVGLVESETRMSLFVNLRSMAYDGLWCKIFVGGGLTAASVAENEWEETEFKSQTLLKVIESRLLTAQRDDMNVIRH